VRVLVVWEPILPSDWRPPSGSTLGRIPDPRVRQFWDPKHVVASALQEIAKHKPQPEPNCCVQKGFDWDEAILYTPHTRWKDEPISTFWDGPVYRIISNLEKAFNEQR
jgi:hypothetical protein